MVSKRPPVTTPLWGGICSERQSDAQLQCYRKLHHRHRDKPSASAKLGAGTDRPAIVLRLATTIADGDCIKEPLAEVGMTDDAMSR